MTTKPYHLILAALCSGSLCSAAPSPEPRPSCKCCRWSERIVKDTDPPLAYPDEPSSPEFNPAAFMECTLHPMKRKGKYMGWKSDEAMAAFCAWFKPLEKGIKLDYKGNTLQFIVNYPETIYIHGFCIYVVALPPDVAKVVAGELKKKDIGVVQTSVPSCQIGRVISNHLVVIYGKSKYDKVMRGILENITDFMDFQ